jgi:hypothetical protein
MLMSPQWRAKSTWSVCQRAAGYPAKRAVQVDKATGVKTEAKKGDILSIPKGTTVLFSSKRRASIFRSEIRS